MPHSSPHAHELNIAGWVERVFRPLLLIHNAPMSPHYRHWPDAMHSSNKFVWTGQIRPHMHSKDDIRWNQPSSFKWNIYPLKTSWMWSWLWGRMTIPLSMFNGSQKKNEASAHSQKFGPAPEDRSCACVYTVYVYTVTSGGRKGETDHDTPQYKYKNLHLLQVEEWEETIIFPNLWGVTSHECPPYQPLQRKKRIHAR